MWNIVGGSKCQSLQAVELSQQSETAVQIVSNPLAPSNDLCFLANRPCGPAGWLALLLPKVSDVQNNPGPTTSNKRVWICNICYKQIHVRKQIYIRCNRIEHWVHLRGAGVRQAQYTDICTCHLYRESRLTNHTDITPPHPSRPWYKPLTNSSSTPRISAQPKHIIFTNIILMADKHNIPKAKMDNNCRFLPEDIVCKITQRNNIMRASACDPALKLLNEEITSDIQKHKQNIWKEHLDAHWDYRHNTHTLWKTIHGLSNRAPPHTLNTSITFNNKIATTTKHIANCFTKHCQTRNTQNKQPH